MSIGAYNENAYENAVLEVLRSMKWDCLFGPDIERDYSDPMLAETFTYQVRKLNGGVPAEAVDDAIRQVRSISGGSLVVRNAKFTNWLQNGVEGACTVAGAQTTRLVKLVDYDHPDRNEPVDGDGRRGGASARCCAFRERDAARGDRAEESVQAGDDRP